MSFSSRGHLSALVFFPTDHSGNFYQMQKLHLTTRANSIAFYQSGTIDETTDGNRVFGRSPQSMDGAAGAPPRLTDGVCGAAQSTGAAALRRILQARPLALRLHRERAIGAKSTDLCAVDFHVGRAQRADNRGSRMLSRTRAHRASGGPGGGRPSSPPERPWPGSGIKGGCFSVRPFRSSIIGHGRRKRGGGRWEQHRAPLDAFSRLGCQSELELAMMMKLAG